VKRTALSDFFGPRYPPSMLASKKLVDSCEVAIEAVLERLSPVHAPDGTDFSALVELISSTVSLLNSLNDTLCVSDIIYRGLYRFLYKLGPLSLRFIPFSIFAESLWIKKVRLSMKRRAVVH